MALVNKAWREGELVPPGSEPGLNASMPWRNATEEKVVAQIAQQRFGYPNGERPDLKTYVNMPDRKLGVRADPGGVVFPDIVVVDAQSLDVRMLAEVETVRSLQAADVIEKWRAFAGLGPLFLFIPMATLEQARGMLKRAKLKPAGLRTWRHMAGMDYTDVIDVPPVVLVFG